MNSLCLFILGSLLAMHLATMPSVDATDPGCNSGFSAFKGHCYLAVVDSVTEPKAIDKCKANGATLASIHSEAEYDFVTGLLQKADPKKKAYFFIGLKLVRQSENEQLISCHFTDGTPFDYGECKMGVGKKPWGKFGAGSEPNNVHGNETCVAMLLDGANPGYIDSACDATRGYVCKH